MYNCDNGNSINLIRFWYNYIERWGKEEVKGFGVLRDKLLFITKKEPIDKV